MSTSTSTNTISSSGTTRTTYFDDLAAEAKEKKILIAKLEEHKKEVKQWAAQVWEAYEVSIALNIA
jgi:hypothetical protein